MKDILLTEDGDIGFSSDISGVNEIMQSIRIILETKRGEFIADETMGLDTSDLLGKQYNERYAVAAIREALQQEPRISTVESVVIDVDRATRQATVALKLVVDNEYSELEVALYVG